MKFLFFCLALFFFEGLLAHGGEDHEVPPSNTALYAKINQTYLDSVKPIFEKKCFDCHSDRTNYPWYYSLPGVKQLIDHDVEEAKEHLDMSFGFPFRGHGSQEKTLEEIEETVAEDEMPLLIYRIMHPGSKVTDEEKALIRKWVQESLALLKR